MGAICRLSPEKNVKLLIEAISSLIKDKVDVQLFIAGEGPLKQDLISLCHKEGIIDNVVFMGWVSDIESFFHKIDVHNFMIF